MNIRVIAGKPAPHGQLELLVALEPGFIAQLFGAEIVTVRFVGSGNTWRRLPTGGRTSSNMEEFLSDEVARQQFSHSAPKE